jgi:hypothetical protein
MAVNANTIQEDPELKKLFGDQVTKGVTYFAVDDFPKMFDDSDEIDSEPAWVSPKVMLEAWRFDIRIKWVRGTW